MGVLRRLWDWLTETHGPWETLPNGVRRRIREGGVVEVDPRSLLDAGLLTDLDPEAKRALLDNLWDLYADVDCLCLRCMRERGDTRNGLPLEATDMICCATCGNKRCPHATDHRHDCTNSNEPGQPGSEEE